MDKYKKKYILDNLHNPKEGKIIDLSQEKLSIPDYLWLSQIIKQSSFAETILLPDVSKNDAEKVLSILNDATIKNSTLTNININFENFNKISENINVMKQQIESRLQRNKRCVFGIHGGGNIGLGLMSDIISKSPYKYEILATSNNTFIRNLVNSVNKLWISHGKFEDSDTTCIKNVSMISRDRQDIIHLYAQSSILALCVTQTILPDIAKDIAYALLKRYEKDGSGLKILVLMNLSNCHKFVYNHIFSEMVLLTKSEEHARNILSGIEFVPTVIDRIVTPISKNAIKKQLEVQLLKVIDYKNLLSKELKIDILFKSKENIRNLISNFDLKFNIFNAEKNFLMYVPSGFSEASRFPLLRISEDLSLLETLKSKYINGPHAILAWVGSLFNYKTISESIKNPYIFSMIKDMIEREIEPILNAEYPKIAKKELTLLKNSFLERCLNNTEDLITRVGRDPLRKLNAQGPIRDTLNLMQKHNLNITTTRLEQGMAAGFLYAIKGIDPINLECQKAMEIYKINNHSFSSVLCYNYDGFIKNSNFFGLNPDKEQILIKSILSKINTLNQWNENRYKLKPKDLVLSKTNDNFNGFVPKTVFTYHNNLFFYSKNKKQNNDVFFNGNDSNKQLVVWRNKQ